MHKILSVYFLGIMLLYTQSSFAQQTKTVKHTAKYTAPLSMSIDEAKLAAIEYAKSEALKVAFGQMLSSHTFSEEMIIDGREIDNFQMLYNTLSKGIWLEDLDDPKVEDPVLNEFDRMMEITATVRGKVRELVTTPIDLNVKLLRNAADVRNEESNFKSGDDMYIYFNSPVDGYLIVYVAGIDGMVQTLLPLTDNTGGSIKVSANKDYMFFAPNDEHTDDFEGLTLTCDGSVEYNRFYFLFSPNPIVKARDNESTKVLSDGLVAPRELSERDFRKWMVSNMDHDSSFNIVLRNIRIINTANPLEE